MTYNSESSIDDIKVAAPCNVSWDSMSGDERARFCGNCKLNVYDLSSMTRAEAENLVFKTEGTICGRFYRRKDGTVITKNCPVGVRHLQITAHTYWTRIAAAIALLLSIAYGAFRWMEADISGPLMGCIVLPPQLDE